MESLQQSSYFDNHTIPILCAKTTNQQRIHSYSKEEMKKDDVNIEYLKEQIDIHIQNMVHLKIIQPEEG